jgi:hypothetical protein
MTKANLAPSLARPCFGCQHSEFIHSDSGPCLFSECMCPGFFPVTESVVDASE